MKGRQELVRELARLSRPTDEVGRDLQAYPWDCEEGFYSLTVTDVRSVLERFLSNELNESELERWASSLEMREDLDFDAEHDKEIWGVIFALASPEINEPITKVSVERHLTLLPS